MTTGARPGLALWERFPKFVLGFLAASIDRHRLCLNRSARRCPRSTIGIVNDLRTWFLIFAFVSIGLEFNPSAVRRFGWRPVAAFGAATVANLVIGLVLALLLFGSFVL